MSNSTTQKYNFLFIIPNALSVVPIPFAQFAKFDEDGNPTGFYTYDELMSMDGNQAFSTPSNTHKILSINVTSIFDLAQKFPQYINAVSPNTVIAEGVETSKWEDENQDDYLWIISSDPTAKEYNYDAFVKVSPLFTIQTEGEEL